MSRPVVNQIFKLICLLKQARSYLKIPVGNFCMNYFYDFLKDLK